MHRRINFDTLIFLTYPSSSSIHNLMFFLKPTYIFLIDPSSWRICNCSNYFLLLEIAVPNMVSCAWLRLGRGGLWLLLLHLLKARRHANQARIRLFHKHNDRSVNQGYNWLDRKHYVRDAESKDTKRQRAAHVKWCARNKVYWARPRQKNTVNAITAPPPYVWNESGNISILK